MSALHLLDDFIECKLNAFNRIIYNSNIIFLNSLLAIETLPSEIQQQLQLLGEKDFQLEGTKKNCFSCFIPFASSSLQNYREIYSRSGVSF